MCGIGVVSRIVVTLIPAFAIARIADSRPPPGPFTRTSHCCIPASCAFLAASYAACCAAKGVPLREPRKPRAPADDCAIKFPSRSVIEIIVLLNDAAIWATPTGTFFFSFFRKTFFFPPALAIAFRIQCSQVNQLRELAHELTTNHYFLPGAFFLAIVARRGPLRVLALVCVRCPRTGSERRCRSPR